MVVIVFVVSMLYAQPCVTEICNEIDDDCDGLVDEGVQTAFNIDYDGDGFPGIITILACTAPQPGWLPNVNGPFDCDDTDTYIYYVCPPDTEVCNGIDDDGDGLIDNADPGVIGQIAWYADADNDGYGDPTTWVMSCSAIPGYVPFSYPPNFDCDDSNPAIHPGALELCNGIDDNCDGLPDPEICNSIDTDCDGVPDNFDLCPGGDDSVDNNGDNIPDCSQLLNYNDYSPDWQCDNNKIYVCHNDNNPHTICVDANSLLPAHYDHGDMIGPCTSCPQNLILPSGNDLSIAVGIAEQLEIDHTEESVLDKIEMEIYPNPADQNITISLPNHDSDYHLSLYDLSGKSMKYLRMKGDDDMLVTAGLENGIYFIQIKTQQKTITKSLVILH